MRINVVTLFPDTVQAGMSESMMKRAQELKLLDLRLYHYRDYAFNKHRKVDDAPYGGGAGLVMQVQPAKAVIEHIHSEQKSHVIYLSPKGKPLTQSRVEELSQMPHLTLMCGHYEGFDQRIIDLYVDEEISIGDYVLTGGELAAMVLMDATVRLLPGVLGKDESHQEDSFSNGLLEYPHYTRPPEAEGLSIPEVLLSGNHALIEIWRYGQSLKITLERRKDLFDAHLHSVASSGEKAALKRLIKAFRAAELDTTPLESYLPRELKKLLYR